MNDNPVVEYFFNVDSILGFTADEEGVFEFDFVRQSSGKDVNVKVTLQEEDSMRLVLYINRYLKAKLDADGNVREVDFESISFTDGTNSLMVFPVFKSEIGMRIIARSKGHSIGTVLKDYDLRLITVLSNKICEIVDKLDEAAIKAEVLSNLEQVGV